MALRDDYPKSIGPFLLTSGSTVLYTAPVRVILSDFYFGNGTAAALAITLYFVRKAGSAGTSNAIVPSGFNIPANDLVLLPFRLILETGDFIQGAVSGGSQVITGWIATDQEHV